MTPRAHHAVRPATVDDVPEILTLIRELAEYERELELVRADVTSLRQALFPSDGESRVHAIVIDHPQAPGRLAAVAVWFVNFSTWEGQHGIYVEDLYVRAALRGTGMGRALLTHLAGVCVERGYRRLEWWVLDWNEPALEFYRTLNAVPQADWTVHRIDGDTLKTLAALP